MIGVVFTNKAYFSMQQPDNSLLRFSPIIQIPLIYDQALSVYDYTSTQNNGKERNWHFTAYINRQNKVISVPNAKKEIIIETNIYVIMIMVQPKIF